MLCASLNGSGIIYVIIRVNDALMVCGAWPIGMLAVKNTELGDFFSLNCFIVTLGDFRKSVGPAL